jgi:hypothetical protein
VGEYQIEMTRHATWYAWKVMGWGLDRTLESKGETLDLTWPDAPLKDKERRREEREYKVTLKDVTGKSYVVAAKDEEELKKLAPGTKREVKLAGPALAD